VMLVPRAHSGNHAARVDSKSLHSPQLPTSPGVAANAFDGSAAQTRDSSIRLGYQETAPSFERHGKRFRLDLDNTVAPADVQRRARFDRGFTTDLGRNHQAARRVDGGCHGMKYTKPSTMRQRVDSMENR